MINLMIVDDEQTTRSSLLELIPWGEWGIDSVKTAENGLAALTLANTFPPSILLTDIRMPKMNGIELSKNIRNLFPDCVIIFLSGFSDKEYLKSAIQLSAVDYLEKPIDIAELKKLFLRIIQQLSDGAINRIKVEHFKSSFNEHIHLLRQEIVLELILAQTQLPQLMNKHGEEALQLSIGGEFTIVAVIFNWTATISNDNKSLITSNILKILNHEAHFPDYKFISGFVNDKYLVVILNESLTLENPRAQDFGSRLLKLMQALSSSSYNASVGYSSPSKDVNQLPALYKASVETIKQQFYAGMNQIYFPNHSILASFDMDKSLFSKFKKLLRNSEIDELILLTNQLTDSIMKTKDPDTYKIRNIYFKFLQILFEVTMQWSIVDSGDINENIHVWQESDARSTLLELSDFLITNIQIILQKTDNKDNSVSKIDEITRFVLQNYTSNQLSIQTIAERTNLSQTYLCAYFKKSSGRTINEYITELRIEKAKELLHNRALKLYEITTSIGLTDTNYFSTLFKKYTGLTPSEYREKLPHD